MERRVTRKMIPQAALAARVINPPVSMPTGESRLVTTFATINGEILRKG